MIYSTYRGWPLGHRVTERYSAKLLLQYCSKVYCQADDRFRKHCNGNGTQSEQPHRIILNSDLIRTTTPGKPLKLDHSPLQLGRNAARSLQYSKRSEQPHRIILNSDLIRLSCTRLRRYWPVLPRLSRLKRSRSP